MFSPQEEFTHDVAELRNPFDNLPAEITQSVMLYASTTPLKVAQVLARVSRRWNEIANENTMWRELYTRRWPNQNKGMNLRSWKKSYRRRAEVESTSMHPVEREIGPSLIPFILCSRTHLLPLL